MTRQKSALTPHNEKVLALLARQGKPMSAYEILDNLRDSGIKAPPTVYRALEALQERGLVHRIESLNAFIACHGHTQEHHAHFAVCRECGEATELEDKQLCGVIHALAEKLNFRVEREMLELIGLCKACGRKEHS